MADVKISGLPGATTPVAGSEVLPIVQSGVTKKVSIDNLTAGKAVSASSFTATNLKTSPATANLDISGTTIAASGSDANVDVNINAKGSGVAYLNQRWGVNQSGALVTSAGNTYDIGNGTNNPRDVNVDRNVIIKGSSTGTTAIKSSNASANNYTTDLPAANTKIPVASQVLTFSGPSAARTITLPDANFTAARTDAAQTFTGNQNFADTRTIATSRVNEGTASKNVANGGTMVMTFTFDAIMRTAIVYIDVAGTYSGGNSGNPANFGAAGYVFTAKCLSSGSITLSAVTTLINTSETTITLADLGSNAFSVTVSNAIGLDKLYSAYYRIICSTGSCTLTSTV